MKISKNREIVIMLKKTRYFLTREISRSPISPFFSGFLKKLSNSSTNLDNTPKTPAQIQENSSKNLEISLKKPSNSRVPKEFSPLPPFKQLKDEDIFEFTNYSFNLQLKSPFRWTPLLQRPVLSTEFSQKMREFSRRRYFCDESSYKELVHCLLTEALSDTDFDFYQNYRCLASKKCKFHGKLPFLLFHKTQNFHLPLIPVVLSHKTFSSLGNISAESWNLAEAVGAGLWALDNMKAVDEKNEINFSRVLHSNGNIWRLYEFDNKGGFKKTGFYVPKNQFQKIYEDTEMQVLVVGLIRFSLGSLKEKERELKSFYDYLDERKYFERVDENVKRDIEFKQKFRWLVPKKLRAIFFKD